MSSVVQKSASPFLPLKKWGLGAGHDTKKNTSPNTLPAGPQTEAGVPSISPRILLSLQPVLTPRKLTVELVPRTCWYSHVRAHVTPEQWNGLRQQTTRQAKSVCAIRGGRGPRWPVACHAVWHDDDAKSVQIVVRLSARCPACHAVQHLGVAELKGHLAEARASFAQVNQWTDMETETSPPHVWSLRKKRRQHPWTLDLSRLKACGLDVFPKRENGRMYARKRHGMNQQRAVPPFSESWKSSSGARKSGGAPSGADAPQ
jgi:hypothetical protein